MDEENSDDLERTYFSESEDLSDMEEEYFTEDRKRNALIVMEEGRQRAKYLHQKNKRNFFQRIIDAIANVNLSGYR